MISSIRLRRVRQAGGRPSRLAGTRPIDGCNLATIIAVAFATGCLANTPRSVAAAESRAESTLFERAGRALASRDCAAAWNTMWPLAKAGDAEARHFLMTAMIYSTNPPGVYRGVPDERAVRTRHKLVLTAYAFAAKGPQEANNRINGLLRKEILIHIRESNLGAAGERVAACYTSAPDAQSCLHLANSLSVVPTFETYAASVEEAEKQTGRGASCENPH